MEKFENVKQNMVSDDELDQVSGGKGMFDIFKTIFRGEANKPTTLEMTLNEDADFNVSTLEMRTNPMSQKTRNDKKIIKL